MKRLWIFLKGYTKECVLAPLFKLFEASLELIVPLVVAAMIDNGIANGDKAYVVKMCFVLIGFAVVGLAFSITAQFFAARAAVGFATELRHGLFAHIERLSFSNIDGQGADTLITRMTGDINQLQSGVNMTLRLFLRSPFIVLGAMIMAFTVDVKAALVFAVLIPVLSLAVFALLLLGIPKFDSVQRATDKLTGKTRENLTGVRVIRAFAKEEDEIRGYSLATELLEKLQVKAANFTALMNPVTFVLINIGLVALIYTGAVRVHVGAISQGAVVALVNYMSQILVELIKLANLVITITKAVACGKRVNGLLEVPEGMPAEAGNEGPATSGAEPQTPVSGGEATGRVPVVSFRNVSVRYYEGADEALKDIDFDVYKGETVGIIGGTGSGKTTLMGLIPRFYDVSAGACLVDGKDVRSYDPEKLREKIVTVLQKAVLFKGTVRDNLRMGKPDANDDEMIEALKRAQAYDFVMAKNGLDTQVEQEGRNFSGGQRQRLSIARALIKKPEVLILDDSSSALDYATDAALRKAISENLGDTTLFVVSQRAGTLAGADKVVVLEDGEAVGIGKHEELLKTCDVYREIANA
ncbi:MAG: ABC transporter ATP-binding protein [Lachnospiraceae bacterium]|nr:ABC transporter ATP-binding protein [Lachnospiraceae bacterium]